MEVAMDYKDMFDSVFNGTWDEEISCFIRNENVPFEYCMKALDRKGLSWQNKLTIVKRKDCPVDVMVKICRKAGERFIRRMVEGGEPIPEDALKTMFKRDWWDFVTYWRLSDDLKRELMSHMVDSDGVIQSNNTLLFEEFLKFQVSLPDDCMRLARKAIDRLRKEPSRGTWYSPGDLAARMDGMLSFMQVPVNEDGMEKAFDILQDSKCRRYDEWTWLAKLAANPSISDYIVVELRMKTPDSWRRQVEELLDANENARDEYRRSHGL